MNEDLIERLRSEADRRAMHPPLPPSPGRVRIAARRQRRGRTVAAVTAVVLICGTAALMLRPSPQSHQVPGNPGPERVAQAHARAIADAVVLPPGARPATTAPTAALDRPSIVPSLVHLATRTRFWTAPGTLTTVGQFFRQTQENGQSFGGSFSGSTKGQIDSIGFTYGELQITVAPIHADTVGIRIDAQVPWTPDKPASERVPGGVRSVEVFDYQGAPGHVRRVLTGAQAQHLADLVNALVRDNRGTHGCPAGTGQRTTLTFTTVHGTAVVDGFFCGSVVLTVGGRRQPALRLSDDLARAVAAALGTAPSPSR